MTLFSDPPRRRRRPSLTPMIDVVFLLLVFFMLASRFGTDHVLPMPLASGGGTAYEGPPRLVDVTPDGLRLNGQPMDEAALIAAMADLTEAPTDPIILRGRDGADLQAIVSIGTALRGAGYTALVLVE
ncbi:ExbD/TolR family protein [Pseudooceanicola nanhaiensis]|uniref:ExbD/TolR family protein n=1 Tax=Pseudooceanicola nanhaiensis TaxID=375761 RepID=UPI001CD6ED95|nr:biopolymer transporter ExbD [Pseudooceanicola nanhaiensis]MCA0921389.1 biopolymer transporter ExbD [Pseudooceanicola nanhaiensis]